MLNRSEHGGQCYIKTPTANKAKIMKRLNEIIIPNDFGRFGKGLYQYSGSWKGIYTK